MAAEICARRFADRYAREKALLALRELAEGRSGLKDRLVLACFALQTLDRRGPWKLGMLAEPLAADLQAALDEVTANGTRGEWEARACVKRWRWRRAERVAHALFDVLLGVIDAPDSPSSRPGTDAALGDGAG